MGCQSPASETAGQTSDWPDWAPDLDKHYAAVDRQSSQAVDLREFGAIVDGVADDTQAVQRAIDSGVKAVMIPPGRGLRMTGSVTIRSGMAILGNDHAAPIIWEGRDRQAFLVQPVEEMFDVFVEDIVFDRVKILRREGLSPSGHLVTARNVKNLTVTRCVTEGVSLCYLSHLRRLAGLYKRKNGAENVDPATVAGFASDHTRDLNDFALIADNHIDYGKFHGVVIRFNFAKHVVVFRNRGTFANISWWGGGARRGEGGELQFLRRVKHCYIADNFVSGAIGGIYGNNGENVTVARNIVKDVTDAGVDFEGCIDCIAYENRVINVGNFGLATFFAAKNIIFRDNYVEQNGDAATLPERYGKGRIGNPQGKFVVGLRSSGFSDGDSVDVTFRRNNFVWSGDAGLGACLGSFFGSLRFEENQFENVLCDVRYFRTGRLTVVDNRFRFTKTMAEPVNLIAGSAGVVEITGNTIEVEGAMPAGSNLILRELPRPRNSQTRITSNRLAAQARSMVIRMTGKPALRTAVQIEDNGSIPVVVENELT